MLTPLLLFAHAAALPRPPFRFPGANVLYQPTFVRAEAARAVTPRGVSLVSLFGWTLGGVFVADWVDSPIGRYREVAVLSGLVFRGGTLGAWASHIVVSEAAAVEAAREFWGLPAREGDIQLQPLEAAGPPRGPRVHFESGSRVVVEGWCGEGEGEARSLRPPSFTLPSLSGGLPASGGLAAGPILRYPLTLTAPRRAALLPRLALSSSSLTTAPLRAVLDAPAASPCLRLDGVDVEAGAAEEVAAGRADAGVEPARLSPMLVVLDSCGAAARAASAAAALCIALTLRRPALSPHAVRPLLRDRRPLLLGRGVRASRPADAAGRQGDRLHVRHVRVARRGVGSLGGGERRPRGGLALPAGRRARLGARRRRASRSRLAPLRAAL